VAPQQPLDRNLLINMIFDSGAQILAISQNCPALPALGAPVPLRSTELSTGFVDNQT
jgi:hypothetical protein